jgi:hypothetical protein
VTVTITSVIVRPVTSVPFTAPLTTAEVLIPLTTAEVLIPTTGANGEPSILTSQVVAPAGPTSTTEPFTGAAAVVAFGSVYVGMLAVAIGLMGLVFAEL